MINQLPMAKHFLAIFLLCSLKVYAQDSTLVADTALTADSSFWRKGGNFNINLSQVGLSNWAGGGNNAISLGLLAGFFSDFESTQALWKNSFAGAYGIQKQEGLSSRKTDDLLELNSEYSRKFGNPHWLWTSSINFKTQFSDGVDYDDVNETQRLISTFWLRAICN